MVTGNVDIVHIALYVHTYIDMYIGIVPIKYKHILEIDVRASLDVRVY